MSFVGGSQRHKGTKKLLSLARKPLNFTIMPVKRVPGGYQWGQSGKVYPTKEQAERQGRAIYASGYREKTAQIKKK